VALAMGKGTSWCHDKHREALAALEQQKKAPA
jgi:hypothetical protein